MTTPLIESPTEAVAPLAGARIEIGICTASHHDYWSLPSRERGLKCSVRQDHGYGADEVAPLAGARIEIGIFFTSLYCSWVAPLAGARIEIM